jgi:hypothetical protein
VFKGAAGAAGLAAVSHMPGAQLIRAQSAAYEIVSFGPVAEGVLPANAFRPERGSMVGIHANGTAFGRVAASAEKFFPALFNADGSLIKLKSGTFGGSVSGLNASGVAVGSAYENPGGRIDVATNDDEGTRPAAWIDGELMRLDLPGDKRYDFSRLGGSASSVSDDGVVFGSANGYDLLWIDGAVQVLPFQDGSGNQLDYYQITPGGTLIGSQSFYDDDGNSQTAYGSIDGTSFSPFNFSDFGQVSAFPVEINSANEVLFTGTPTDLPFANITGPGLDPVVIDFREEGIWFSVTGFNSKGDVVGSWRARQDLDAAPALLRDGELTPLADLLPADHGFENMIVSGISDDGIIAGHAWDADGGFHPLLFVPA